MLKKIGYNPDKIQFVPVSGWEGDNVMEMTEKMSWYAGPSLFEAVSMFSAPKRPLNKPLRIPIGNIYKVGGVGTVASGKIESGTLKEGQ